MGRGELKSQILDKKEKLSPTMFAMNYSSEWIGAVGNSLVNIQDVMNLRTMSKAELKGSPDGEYIVSVDVARSQKTSNNQCSISVLKIIRNKKGNLKNVRLVNIINVPSIINFKSQAQEVMRVRNLYNAKAVVVDGNGLGSGLIDSLVLEQIDPSTGESLGCYKCMNCDIESELDDAEEILYNINASSVNNGVIVNFMDMVASKKLQLLEKKTDTAYDIQDEDYYESEILPYLQTDLLLEELANLKLETSESTNKLTVKQEQRKINKDRYSALAYGLYYIEQYESEGQSDSMEDTTEYLLIN